MDWAVLVPLIFGSNVLVVLVTALVTRRKTSSEADVNVSNAYKQLVADLREHNDAQDRRLAEQAAVVERLTARVTELEGQLGAVRLSLRAAGDDPKDDALLRVGHFVKKLLGT